jgi:hypothetical protein
VDTIGDVFIGRGESAALQVAAELYTVGAAVLGCYRRRYRIATNFNVNHAAKVRIK